MGTKFSSLSASGYNSVPPADDGTVSEANKGKWSTIKTKLADPVKTLVDSAIAALVTHFDNGPRALTSNTTLGASDYGKIIQVSGSSVTLTLTDAATLTAGWWCDIRNTDASNTVALGRATGADTLNGVAANGVILPGTSLRVFVIAAATGFYTDTFNRALQSSDAGATAGPVFTLDRSSASPAASDVLGAIPFTGRDSAGGIDTYAQVQAEIVDHTSTSEDGRLAIQTVVAGTLATRGYIGAGFYTVGGSDQGANTIQASSGLYDGSNRVGIVKLAGGSVSSQATLDINMSTMTAYKHKFVKVTAIPVTDDVDLLMRFSTDGGSTYISSAGHYFLAAGAIVGTGQVFNSSSTATSIPMNNNGGGAGTHVGNAAGEFIRVNVYIDDSNSTALIPTVRADTVYTAASGNLADCIVSGRPVSSAQDTDAIRFLFSSGNISAANYEVYGWN